MPDRTTNRLIRLREQIIHDRKQDIKRAVDYYHHDDQKMAAYHCGLADARNGLSKILSTIIAGGAPDGVD